MKDLTYTAKEIKSQEERIQRVRDDPEKDEADVKKQEEVLAEYTNAKPDEEERLHGFFTGLETAVLEACEDADLKITEEFAKAHEALKAAAIVLMATDGPAGPKLDPEDWEATLSQLPQAAAPAE